MSGPGRTRRGKGGDKAISKSTFLHDTKEEVADTQKVEETQWEEGSVLDVLLHTYAAPIVTSLNV